MTPKHAQLLAGDLDDETLIRYIDRFLMFYIRTADRLQRTAPWLEALDGGLEHLREVVCDDSLGLAAEFEAAVARHVDGYACEWKGVLDDPGQVVAVRLVRQRPRRRRPHHHVHRTLGPEGADKPRYALDASRRRNDSARRSQRRLWFDSFGVDDSLPV